MAGGRLKGKRTVTKKGVTKRYSDSFFYTVYSGKGRRKKVWAPISLGRQSICHDDGHDAELLNDAVDQEYSPPAWNGSDEEYEEEPEDEPDTSATARRKRDWATRQSNRQTAWKTLQHDLLCAAAELCAGDLAACCLVCGSPANLRCQDCGCGPTYYCRSCLLSIHGNGKFYHRTEEKQGGVYVPFPVVGEVWAKRCQHEVGLSSKKLLTCVDSHGFQHQARFCFCSCEPEAMQLLCMGYWPGTPTNPCICFSLDFMESLNLMVLECQVSVKKFCDAVACKYTSWTPIYAKNIYKVLIGCFPQFRYFQYCKQYMLGYDGLENGTACPACPKESGVNVHAFDGCFGLVRKCSSGSSDDGSQHRNTLFLSQQEEVDTFVDDHSRKTKGKSTDELGCSSFHAGEVSSSIFSKGKNVKLDETGLLGTVCRHDHPLHFFNCKYGERIGYAVFAIKTLLARTENSIKPYFVYDIACILDKHMQRLQLDFLGKVTVAVPAFHAYGHNMQCQRRYSPRRVEGIGLTDGEGTERLWSFLREFAPMTKEMTRSNRHDLLNDALLHFSERKRSRIGKLLVERLLRAVSLKASSTEQLQALILSVPALTLKKVEELVDAEKTLLQAPTSSADTEETWQSGYVRTLMDVNSLRNQIETTADSVAGDAVDTSALYSKMQRVDKAARKIERDRFVLVRWEPSSPQFIAVVDDIRMNDHLQFLSYCRSIAFDRAQWISLKKKYSSGGQSIAQKIARQIQQLTKKLRAKVRVYTCKCRCSDTANRIPQIAQLLDCSSECYSSLDPMHDIDTHIAPSMRRQVVDLQCLVSRCAEEEKLVLEEMRSALKFYCDEVDRLSVVLCGEATVLTPLVRLRLCQRSSRLAALHSAFAKYVPDFCLPLLSVPLARSNSDNNDNSETSNSDED